MTEAAELIGVSVVTVVETVVNMVTKHTRFLKRIQETFRRCSQDIYVAAIATRVAPRVVQVDELGLD